MNKPANCCGYIYHAFYQMQTLVKLRLVCCTPKYKIKKIEME